MPTQSIELPRQVSSTTISFICHHALSGSCEGLYIVMGFCQFPQPVTQLHLQQLSGPQFQWIPRSIAHLYSQHLNVDFKSWAKDEFDIEQFLDTVYPWDQVHNILVRLHYPLPPNRSSSFVDIWPDD